MNDKQPYGSIQSAKSELYNQESQYLSYFYLERLQESVSQMIRERMDFRAKGTLKEIHLQTYGKHKQHLGMVKWSRDKIPTMYDLIKKQSISTPSPNKYSGHLKLQVPRFFSGFSKVKK
jgi:hypothetical protein